jgi:hypothetical protein
MMRNDSMTILLPNAKLTVKATLSQVHDSAEILSQEEDEADMDISD